MLSVNTFESVVAPNTNKRSTAIAMMDLLFDASKYKFDLSYDRELDDALIRFNSSLAVDLGLNMKHILLYLESFFEAHKYYAYGLNLHQIQIPTKDTEKLVDSLIDIHKQILTIPNKTKQAKEESFFLLYLYLCIKFTKISGHETQIISNENLTEHLVNCLNRKSNSNSELIEFLLSIYYDKLSEKQAKIVLEVLHKKNKLAEDLAQLLLSRFPQLKDSTQDFDFSRLSYKQVINNLDHYTKLSQRQTELITRSGAKTGKLGIELEVEMINTFGCEPFRSILKQITNNGYIISPDRIVRQFDNGEQRVDYASHYEIRNRGRGKFLDASFLSELLDIKVRLLKSPYFRGFDSNHIHVDKQKNLDPRNSPILFRRYKHSEAWLDYDKGLEAQAVPLYYEPLSKHHKLLNSSSFQISRLVDQMQIVNGLYNLQFYPDGVIECKSTLKEINFYNFICSLSDKEVNYLPNLIYQFRDQKSQDLICKFYLWLACTFGKQDLIPHILRCHQKLSLPNIGNSTLETLQEASTSHNPESLANNIAALYHNNGIQYNRVHHIRGRLNPVIFRSHDSLKKFVQTLLANNCEDLLTFLMDAHPDDVESLEELFKSYCIEAADFRVLLEGSKINAQEKVLDIPDEGSLQDLALAKEILISKEKKSVDLLSRICQTTYKTLLRNIVYKKDSFDYALQREMKKIGRIIFDLIFQSVKNLTSIKPQAGIHEVLNSQEIRKFLGISIKEYPLLQ